MIAQTISHYRIVEKLGAGGMGVVYKAEDTRLDRFVALKFLPEELTGDRQAMERFRREAKATSALNHPNICTIHDIGEENGRAFIVMEYLEGEILREQMNRGPMTPKKAVDYGVQTAHGLAAAHEKSIVHRDLKPENLFVTKDGRIKILDFGLAKLLHTDGETQFSKQTLDTQPGAVLGTVGYMAPEQVRGLPVDHRADIFAFGAILYELLTGQRAFHKSTFADTMSAILKEDPPLVSQTTANIPPALQRAVQRCLEKSPEQRFQSASDLAFALEVASDPGGATKQAIASAAARRTWRWIAGPAGALAVLVGALLWHPWSSPRLTEKDTIVLADFTNTTGDPVFDKTLREGLSVQLEQSPFLTLVSDERIRQTLQMMKKSSDARLTPEIAREVCLRTSSTTVLEGSMAQIGTQYSLILKAVNCSNGETLTSAEAQVSDKARVLEALGKVSSEIRKQLGESPASLQRFDTPLEQATTPSLEALKAYTLAYEALGKDYAAEIPLLQKAIQLDPNFAMAYLRIGYRYWKLGEGSLANETIRKAYELRGGVSEREKLWIELMYHRVVTGDLNKGHQICEVWVQTYPRDRSALVSSGDLLADLGQYDQALGRYREAFRLYPENSETMYPRIIGSYIALNRFDEARAAADVGVVKNVNSPAMMYLRYKLAFFQNDAAGMEREVALALGKPGLEDEFFSMAANTAAYSGKLERARALSRKAIASGQQVQLKGMAAGYAADAGLREALFGNVAQARDWAASARRLATSRDVQYLAALALASEVSTSQSLGDDLAKRFPQDTLVHLIYLPTLHAQIALSNNRPSEAIQYLQVAAQYDLAATVPTALYPAYVRGMAYLASHQGSEAASEFQKILDHRGLVANSQVAAIARLQIGRAYAIQGDTSKAKAAYHDFLTFWKDADPDIPILIAAKAEYAKLK